MLPRYHLINSLTPEQYDRHCTTDVFVRIFLKIKDIFIFLFTYHKIMFLRFGNKPGLDDGLAQGRSQTIISTTDNPLHLWIYALHEIYDPQASVEGLSFVGWSANPLRSPRITIYCRDLIMDQRHRNGANIAKIITMLIIDESIWIWPTKLRSILI